MSFLPENLSLARRYISIVFIGVIFLTTALSFLLRTEYLNKRTGLFDWSLNFNSQFLLFLTCLLFAIFWQPFFFTGSRLAKFFAAIIPIVAIFFFIAMTGGYVMMTAIPFLLLLVIPAILIIDSLIVAGRIQLLRYFLFLFSLLLILFIWNGLSSRLMNVGNGPGGIKNSSGCWRYLLMLNTRGLPMYSVCQSKNSWNGPRL